MKSHAAVCHSHGAVWCQGQMGSNGRLAYSPALSLLSALPWARPCAQYCRASPCESGIKDALTSCTPAHQLHTNSNCYSTASMAATHMTQPCWTPWSGPAAVELEGLLCWLAAPLPEVAKPYAPDKVMCKANNCCNILGHHTHRSSELQMW